MPTDRKKLIVLIGLVIFWIGLILVQRSQQGPQSIHVARTPQGTSTKRTPRATPGRKQVKKRTDISHLKLGRIERVRPPFTPQVRNIFATIAPVPSTPRPTPQVAPALPPPPDPFLEEARTIRFLGFAEAEGRAMAFVGYGSEAFVVTEQEVFGSKFRVKQVEEDVLILSSLDGSKEVRLELGPGPATAPPGNKRQRENKP